MKRRTLKAVDLFCGAGGTSTGLIEACKAMNCDVSLTAINHWDVAIATHSSNHPDVKHMCASLETLNPRKLFKQGELELLWASPECMHHSVARGGKPINDQSRSTAWHVISWAEALQPKVIIVENVREFQTWGPIGSDKKPLKRRKGEIFQSWINCLKSLGYKVEWKVLCAADYGDPTTRSRLFIQAVRGNRKVVWPEPSHGALDKNGADMFRGAREKWVPARDIINWGLQSRSIFDRKKPLSEKTMRRIWIGLEKFGLKPFIVPGFGDAANQTPRTHDIDQPLPTIPATGHAGIVEPFIIGTDQTGASSACVNEMDDPLTTITTKQRHALVQPFIVKHHGASDAESIDRPVSALTTKQKHSLAQPFLIKLRGTNDAADIDKPAPTVTSGGNLALAEPFLVQVNRGDGGKKSGSDRRSMSLREPLPTVCGNGEFALVEPSLLPQQSCGALRPVSEPVSTVAGAGAIALVEPFIVKYYGTGGATSVDRPLDTVTVKERFGLVRPIIIIEGEEYLLDIRFRMLQPDELAAAQGFPTGYKFSGTKTQKVKQIGNAVPKNLAKALCVAALRQWTIGKARAA